MTNPSLLAGWCLSLLIALPASGDQAAIVVDGQLADWSGVTEAHVDPAGDAGPAGHDLRRLWVADDPRFLHLRLELEGEITLDENNDLVLYLDTDDDPQTGLPVAGIGAELEWRFGSRQGIFHGGSGDPTVFHDDLRLRSAPTVSSAAHEIAFGRDTLPDGSVPLFLGPVVRLAFRDEDGSGDRLPDTGSVAYTLDVGTAPPLPEIPFSRGSSDDLRVATWNVLTDNPWQNGDEPRFGRILAAVSADIVNFQEVYDHTPQEAADLVASWVDLPPGESWHAAGNADCKTVSRFPIVQTWAIGGNLAALIDRNGEDYLVINAHLPCCANDTARQAEVDELLAFLRDAQLPGGSVTLQPDTPIVVVGDMNFVTVSQHLTSLLTGDVVDEGTHGPDFDPDWDGTPLTSVVGRQTEKGMAYTWRSDSSSFWPGHLDFLIYSDSVLELAHTFIVYTPEMSPAARAANGVLATDSLASDHLLFTADFRPPAPSGASLVRGDCLGDGALNIVDVVFGLEVLFGGAVAGCADACDANDDEGHDLADAIYLLDYLFDFGPPPPPPFSVCGEDPEGDALGCSDYSPCP